MDNKEMRQVGINKMHPPNKNAKTNKLTTLKTNEK